MTKMLAIRLPDKVDRRLAKLAKRARRTKTDLAREAILEHLEDLEDYYLAVARLDDQLQSIPLEEVERRLGLED
jgi:RHH-type rel operon transcriptional repressor/antitoxin RelB